MKKISMLLVVLLSGLIGFSQSMFLTAGPVRTDNPLGQPVLAYSIGISNSGSAHTGGGSGTGKANYQDLSVTMNTGRMSPDLIKSVALGTHFQEVVLSFYDEKQKMYYKITLKEAMVTSYQQGSSCGKKDCEAITENVTFTYAQIEYKDVVNNQSTSLSTIQGLN
ncbi:MAG TPA: type VI secretion system tube protein Hcp [Flavitalea sp.]|nr:type VI secretion system tube protein Hcp [Flavitalea sp.]